MKRSIHISLLVSLLLLALHGCAVGQAKEEQTEQPEDTVYVTRTGKKYHLSECRYLSTRTALTLPKATEGGYTPCSVCKPPVQTANRDKQKEGVPVDAPAQRLTTPPQQQSTTSRQCMAYTKSGLRCKRTTTNANGKCWQHE